MKQKGHASIWYWIDHMTITFDITYDLDLVFFQVKFLNNCISNQLDTEPNYATLPFDHTHDLGLSRSKFEIALSQEWKGQLTWNERDVSRSFVSMTMTLDDLRLGGWMYQIVTRVTVQCRHAVGTTHFLWFIAVYILHIVLFCTTPMCTEETWFNPLYTNLLIRNIDEPFHMHFSTLQIHRLWKFPITLAPE